LSDALVYTGRKEVRMWESRTEAADERSDDTEAADEGTSDTEDAD
jgi:hypothetical protein